MVQAFNFKIIRDIDIIDKNKLYTVAPESRPRGHQYKLFFFPPSIPLTYYIEGGLT